ncbi:hypothetical protein [Rhodococcus sp. ACS1]|uniref:hypothetical protein n=1 Tax=Rhodococcus sp. ACS1 TaxID=2028570 RepID=UPI000B22C6B9|nr:hypothetical protein [Rhodococcus sp. ACS1]
MPLHVAPVRRYEATSPSVSAPASRRHAPRMYVTKLRPEFVASCAAALNRS